jgi:hypothetical protein
MEVNKTHQLLVCAGDVNFSVENVNIISENTYSRLDASKEVDLEVNAEIRTYIYLYVHVS